MKKFIILTLAFTMAMSTSFLPVSTYAQSVSSQKESIDEDGYILSSTEILYDDNGNRLSTESTYFNDFEDESYSYLNGSRIESPGIGLQAVQNPGGYTWKNVGVGKTDNKSQRTTVEAAGILISAIGTLLSKTKKQAVASDVASNSILSWAVPSKRYYATYNYTDQDGVNYFYKTVTKTYSDSSRKNCIGSRELIRVFPRSATFNPQSW